MINEQFLKETSTTLKDVLDKAMSQTSADLTRLKATLTSEQAAVLEQNLKTCKASIEELENIKKRANDITF
jgi:hypothetical protein